MKEIISMAVLIAAIIVAGKDVYALPSKYQKACDSEISIIAIMDVSTKSFKLLDSTYPELHASKDVRELMRKNNKQVTKSSFHLFGPTLRPFVLGYIEKNNTNFHPTLELLNVNDYHEFGDEVANYISIEEIFEPFISFGMLDFQFSEVLDSNALGSNISYYYAVGANGYAASVSIEELMKAYAELFTDPDYIKTKKLLLQNFHPGDKRLGGVEFSHWLYKEDQDLPFNKSISKSLILYTGNDKKGFVISLILVDIKNRKCRQENYLYENYAKKLLETAKNL